MKPESLARTTTRAAYVRRHHAIPHCALPGADAADHLASQLLHVLVFAVGCELARQTSVPAARFLVIHGAAADRRNTLSDLSYLRFPVDSQRSSPVDLGKGQAVRDLAAYKNDLLILSGPQDRDGGKAAVYKWTPGGEAVKLAELDPAGSSDRQPETLMVLETSEDAVRCLVFDDGDKSANPRIFEIPVAP